MATEFKVMPWLRALRDRNAKIEKGMSNKEILKRTREGAARFRAEAAASAAKKSASRANRSQGRKAARG